MIDDTLPLLSGEQHDERGDLQQKQHKQAFAVVKWQQIVAIEKRVKAKYH
ncbi:hypothetical protein WM008_02595 [Vibrio vulnificus]|nr:hypothetical protein [Vibrio vulnificus]MCU8467350.1 hypothetical protein [Vibrio vulnificus]